MKLWQKSVIIFLVLFNLYFTLFYNRFWSNGDEVHYLTVTSSLIQDRDLNLTNNYANKDYFSHHPVEEPPHAITDNASQLRPFHSVLLSILTIPGYQALNLSGARINMLVLHLFGVWLLWFVLGRSNFGSTVRTAVLALYLTACPILIYATIIFPDLLQGYLIASLLVLLQIAGEGKKKQNYFLLAASSLGGVGIFLHLKLTLLVTLILVTWLIVQALVRLRAKQKLIDWRQLLCAVTPFTFFALVLAFINYRWYGNFGLSGPVVGAETSKMFRITPFQGFFGQLLDIETGLLWWAPGLVIWSAGFFTWFKKDWKSFAITIIPVSLFTILVSTFVDWKAGYSPAGRYVIYLLPVLIVSGAYGVQTLLKSLIGRVSYFVLLLLNVLLTYPIFFSISFGYPFYQNTNWHWQFYYNMTSFGSRIQNWLYFFNFSVFNWKRALLVGIILLLLGITNYLLWLCTRPLQNQQTKTKNLES